MDALKLPQQFFELMSAYIPEKNDIWLAGQDGNDPAVDAPDLMHSADGGKTWQTLKWNSPLLRQIPKYWLEGQMRAMGGRLSDSFGRGFQRLLWVQP